MRWTSQVCLVNPSKPDTVQIWDCLFVWKYLNKNNKNKFCSLPRSWSSVRSRELFSLLLNNHCHWKLIWLKCFDAEMLHAECLTERFDAVYHLISGWHEVTKSISEFVLNKAHLLLCVWCLSCFRGIQVGRWCAMELELVSSPSLAVGAETPGSQMSILAYHPSSPGLWTC